MDNYNSANVPFTRGEPGTEINARDELTPASRRIELHVWPARMLHPVHPDQALVTTVTLRANDSRSARAAAGRLIEQVRQRLAAGEAWSGTRYDDNARLRNVAAWEVLITIRDLGGERKKAPMRSSERYLVAPDGRDSGWRVKHAHLRSQLYGACIGWAARPAPNINNEKFNAS